MRSSISILIVTLVLSIFTSGQQRLTAEDYARAEKMMAYNTNPLVDRADVRPNWLPDGKFWYSVLTATGQEFVLVDPISGEKKTGKTAAELGIPAPSFGGGGRFGGGLAVRSPDGKREVFIKDWNLWLREVETRKESQLTTDGVKDHGYATDNAGWRKSDRPIVLWSPDSKKIATYRQDQRHVSDMYLVTTNVGAPKLEAWKYPLPQDKDIIKIERVIFDVEKGTMTKLKIEPDDRRGTLCDDIACDGTFGDNQWSPDSQKLAFISSSRDHKRAKFRIADAATGNVIDVFEEVVETQYESGRGTANWRYIAGRDEVIWYSQRDDWGHLYLYDVKTGKPKLQITKGNFVVTRMLRVDETARTIVFEAVGREPGRDPYFAHMYRINMDGSGIKLLTPDDGHHQVTWSRDGKYFVDTYSKPNEPAVSVLRDAEGRLVNTLEATDVSRLRAAGWKPPTPITVRSRDGKWDLYGLMFTPSDLDTKRKYPVVNYIYPGPQGGGVGSRAFAASRSDHQALAELGFVVVVIDGTCNPHRSKTFHDVCYGNMADNTIEDQIAGIRQLAERFGYLDLDRVGMWGHSGGGFATAAALFRYPDFYKVGVSQAGNHDNRNYEDDWGERYIGLMVGPDGKHTTNVDDAKEKSNYTDQANQIFAANLKGKLLLAHGNMDDNVPPYNTLLVVDALIKANKDFDLIIYPNARHGFGNNALTGADPAANLYMTRRRWDYFVKHLMGAEPPLEYKMTPRSDPRSANR